MIYKKLLFVLLPLAVLMAHPPKPSAGPLPAGALEKQLAQVKLPPGFSIHLYAAGIANARSMALSPNGTLFVGSRHAGNVYAVRDTDGDQRADRLLLIARGLRMPNGVAYSKGALFVA